MFEKRNVHFVGIGGIGMSAIAEVLHSKGFKVSGSDINQNLITRRLRKKGIKVYNKHATSNIKNADVIVYSSAIKANNVEINSGARKKIPIYSRAMMLAEVMRLKKSITVSGSHGKTTTTSLISSILEYSGYDPTIINGGIINGINANAKLGNGEWIVAEADESDGSFTMLPSTIGVINNIDLEHLDFYNNINEIKDSFVSYANNIPFYGFLAINIDDNNIKNILERISHKKTLTYGLSKDADFYAENIKIIKKGNSFFSCFDIVNNTKSKKVLKNILIKLIGPHNVTNTLAAYCICKALKVPDSKIKIALKKFQGVKRRFSVLYNSRNTMVIDDYAHHPKEITMTLDSLKSITKKKLIVVFEPHRFSRLKNLKEEFIKSFKNANSIFVLPVYTAGEKMKKEFTNLNFSKLIKKKYDNKMIRPISDQKTLNLSLYKIICNGDNVIFLGAGQSSKIADSFVNFLKKNEI